MNEESGMARAETSSVGRAGELVLGYVRQGNKTILSTSRSRSPWHLFPPVDLDGSGCAYTLLVNPSGGLVGGDRLSIQGTLGPQTHVLISTPSASRVYRSLAEISEQTVDLTLQPGAILEWVPEPTIPYAGCRFRQRIHVQLDRGAALLLWDVLASGRMARGERWAFSSLESEVRICTASGGTLLERYRLVPAEREVGLVREWDYVASIYAVADQMPFEVWSRLEERAATALEGLSSRVLGGISMTAVPGVAVKLLARSWPELKRGLEVLWEVVRDQFWGLPLPDLRRY